MRIAPLERTSLVKLLAVFSAILATVSVLLFSLRPKRDILVPSPVQRADWNDYDDRDVGGTSRCEVLSNSPLRMATYSSPVPGSYWGIEWSPAGTGSKERFWGWSPRDSLVVRWRARKARHLQVHLCGSDPALTRPDAPLTRRYLAATLPVGEGWTRASIALGDFTPPEWWLQLHPGLVGDPLAFLPRTVNLQVVPATGAAFLGEDTIEIEAIEVVPSTSMGWLATAILALISGLAAAWFHRQGSRANRILPPLELSPRSLDAPAPDLQRLLEHLNAQYHRPDLDLATVAKECALSPRRVTTLLGDRGESFKSSLNRLRLDEARRLLGATDLQVSEIGYKVGYRNTSHFHRMFRDRFGVAPGVFRDGLRNPPGNLQNLQIAETTSHSTESG